jgi:hypothetical protein
LKLPILLALFIRHQKVLFLVFKQRLNRWFSDSGGGNSSYYSDQSHFQNGDEYFIVAVMSMRDYDHAIDHLHFQLIILSLISA